MRAATIFKLNRNLRDILCGRPVWNGASVRLISVKPPVADVIQPQKKKPPSNGPGLKEFLVAGKNIPAQTSPENVPYLSTLDYNGHGRMDGGWDYYFIEWDIMFIAFATSSRADSNTSKSLSNFAFYRCMLIHLIYLCAALFSLYSVFCSFAFAERLIYFPINSWIRSIE